MRVKLFSVVKALKKIYIEPTLIDNVNLQDKVMQEEIFGPILPIVLMMISMTKLFRVNLNL